MEGGFSITCRPSLALLRDPCIIEFRAEFSSVQGPFTNHELTLYNSCSKEPLNPLLVIKAPIYIEPYSRSLIVTLIDPFKGTLLRQEEGRGLHQPADVVLRRLRPELEVAGRPRPL